MLAAIRKSLEECTEDQFACKYGRTMAGNSIKKARKHKKCPTCERDCDSINHELKADINGMEDLKLKKCYNKGQTYTGCDGLVAMIAERTAGKTSKRKREEIETRHSKLKKELELFERGLPSYKRRKVLDRLIPEAVEKYGRLQDKIASAKEAVRSLGRKRSDIKAKIDELLEDEKRVLGIRRNAVEAQDGFNFIKTERLVLDDNGDSGGAKSLEQLRDEYQDIQGDKRKCEAKCKRISKEIASRKERLGKLKDERHKLNEVISKKRKEEEEKETVDARRMQLKEEIPALRSTIDEVDEEVSKLKKAIAKLASERSRADEELNTEEGEARKGHTDVSNASHTLSRLAEELHRQGGSDTEGSIPAKRVEAAGERVTEAMEAVDVAKTSIEGLKNKAKDFHKQHATALRELEDMDVALDCLKGRAEIEKLRVRIRANKDLLEKDSGIDFEEVDEKILTLRARVQDLDNTLSRNEGEIGVLESSLGKCKASLASEELKDVVNRRRVKEIEVNTAKMAESDLDKYYKALDSALMAYHSEKIKEINVRIRELWGITYKGGDIEYIEVKAVESKATKTQVRTYKYNVIMRKGGVDLTMRGRCSAGQKVLASLVIRLALAEAFSTSCGIIALDEPTTNLDVENQRGFVEALERIIKRYEAQDSFQFIVITHDDEFVDMLRHNGLPVDKKWKLLREPDPYDEHKYISRIVEEDM